MPREKLIDVQKARDEYQKQLAVSNIMVQALARGNTPDASEAATMPDGSFYTLRVYDVARASGGVVLIGFASCYGGHRATFDTQYFDDALVAARKTVIAMPESWAYRDAFERLEKVVRKLQQKVA